VTWPSGVLAATWFIANPYGLLAAGGIVTAVFAILAFQKQSAEVSALLQDWRREAEQRRGAQAALVYITLGFTPQPTLPGQHDPTPGLFGVRMHNTSGQPVYDVQAWCMDAVSLSQVDSSKDIGVAGPGSESGAGSFVPLGAHCGAVRWRGLLPRRRGRGMDADG
jgi:hypothetical protein